MIFNEHSEIKNKHAFLGASTAYRWLGKHEEDLIRALCGVMASEVGTILHEVAATHIKYGFKLKKSDKSEIMLKLLEKDIPPAVINYIDFNSIYTNLMTYTNDCISDFMKPEVGLKYSDRCFGTADAINYNEATHLLKIYDLKTGTTPAHIEQLMIYAALFFLEYRDIKLAKSDIELRIYQSNEILVHTPGRDEILPIMDEIKHKSDFMLKTIY